jgi:hypothetical protein
VDEHAVRTLHVLLKLVAFFNFKSLDQHDKALDILLELGLLPSKGVDFGAHVDALDDAVHTHTKLV